MAWRPWILVRNGGTVRLTQEGWFQRRIADFSYDTALKKADGAKPVIGVNRYVDPEETFDIELHPYDASTADRQIARLQRVRRERDNAKIDALLDRLIVVAKDERENIMPITIELVDAGATMGDIIEKLKALGFQYVTLDLQGFRSGSMNEVLTGSQKSAGRSQ